MHNGVLLATTFGTWALMFLNYLNLKGYMSTIQVMNGKTRDTIFPFPNNDTLYVEWARLLKSPPGSWPVLVTIPLGAYGNVQLMTAIAQDLSLDSGKSVQEKTGSMGIRWLHCQ